MCASSVDRDPFEQLAEEFAERLRRGEHPPLSEYIARCPEREADIRELFPALAMVENFKPSGEAAAVPFAPAAGPIVADLPDRLGDYRILRYLGEGGMGVVYEAVRESLRSHVALKVMHPQFRNRQSYLRRFRTEARSAARLHHTNIVSVFDYGVHEGVCYYAMRYIAGHSLDKVLRDIRQLRRENAGSAAALDTVAHDGDDKGRSVDRNDSRRAGYTPTDPLRQTVVMGLVTGRYSMARPADESEGGGSSIAGATYRPASEISEDAAAMAMCAENLALRIVSTIAAGTEPTEPVPGRPAVKPGHAPAGTTAPPERLPDLSGAARPGEPSFDGTASSLAHRSDDRYYREVARLGIQIADALAYAHERGVLHRDIKPPNLILDPLGNIWITDFGLAKFEEGEDLSQSHDLIGTLRYMAPERFRGVSTARCDVYALGATLYEMITLQPPFQGKDQLQLIHQVENDTPVPPREIERRIPRDLETIVLKALAKSPGDRFDTAKDMADELRLFLDNRPIRSRPIPVYQQIGRWCKRNPGLAGASLTAAALVVVLAVGASRAAWIFRDQRNQIRGQLEQVERSEAKARRANEEGRKQLFQAQYERARAQRFSRREGQRFQGLAALEEAERIGRELHLPPERFEPLRDEAIAAMALPDLEPTGRVITRPSGFIASAYAFDPSMTHYALGFRDGTIQVRLFADDHEVARLRGAVPSDIRHFLLSDDGRYLATKHSPALPLTIWDIERRTVALDDPGSVSCGRSARFSPDSRQLALSHDDGELLVYDLASGQIVRRWHGPGQAQDLAFRPDGARIAVLCVLYKEKVPTCQILQAETGRLVGSIRLPAGGEWVAWSPDGNTLATTCQDRKIYLWDAATGIRRATLEGHTNGGLSAAFHPAGTLLASNDWDGRLRLWDPVLGHPWFSVTGASASLAFSRDGNLCVSREEELITYQVDPAREYRTLAPVPDRPVRHLDVAIRRDGRVAALGTSRGVAFFDLANGSRLAFLPISHVRVLFEASGDLLTSGAAGAWRWPVRLESDQGLRIGPPQRLRLPPGREDFATDRSGRIVALAHYDRAFVQTSERTFTLSPLADVRSIAVSPDGAWVATGSHGKNGFQVWRSSDGARVADRNIEGLVHATFSPDGKWLMTQNPPCRLWEVGTWREARRIGGLGLCFSADGRLLATQDASRVIRLVETESARTVARLESPDLCNVFSASFGPDGSRLVISTNDGPAVHVWDLRRIRRRLARMGLDWDAPPYSETDPAAETSHAFSSIVVDLGPLKPELQSLVKQAVQLEQSGNVDGAIDRLRHAARIFPDSALALNNLAWLLAKAPGSHRQLDEALRHARRAVELEPGEQLSLNTLGVIFYRAGRFDEAIETLEKSLSAGKGQLAAFDLFFLAMAHHRLDHGEQARARFDQAGSWMEAHRKTLSPGHLKELTDFRAEAEAVLAGAPTELPDDVFAEPRG